MSDKIEQRRAALEEVRRMLEEQRKECLDETVSMGLNRIRADELDNALINLRALAAEPGADTGTTPPDEGPWRGVEDMLNRIDRRMDDEMGFGDDTGTLRRILAQEFNAALAATQLAPVVTEYCNCYGECACDPRPHKAVRGMDY